MSVLPRNWKERVWKCVALREQWLGALLTPGNLAERAKGKKFPDLTPLFPLSLFCSPHFGESNRKPEGTGSSKRGTQRSSLCMQQGEGGGETQKLIGTPCLAYLLRGKRTDLTKCPQRRIVRASICQDSYILGLKVNFLKLCAETISWEKTKSGFECPSDIYAINNRFEKNARQYVIIFTF